MGMTNTNTITGNEMTKAEALTILAAVKAKLGRNYKQAIRTAWMNGNYDGEGLGEWDSRLQQIRNTFGHILIVVVTLTDGRRFEFIAERMSKRSAVRQINKAIKRDLYGRAFDAMFA
jgi:hypothetical protein